MITGINNEDRLVQQTFADYLRDHLQWESLYAWNDETFGPDGLLGRSDEREVVLTRDLRTALQHLNPTLPPAALEDAVRALTAHDYSRTMLQHNRDFYRLIRDGVPVSYRDDQNQICKGTVHVIDFRTPANNRFLVVRELKIKGLRSPHYNRRADLVCFVNGLPLVFIELKAVYVNIRAAYDNNLSDYRDTIPHMFHHNAFLVVSNGDKARCGSITSRWEHFAEWKRNDEKAKGDLDARVLLDGMLSKDRLLDLVENFILFDDSKPDGTRKIVARNHQVLGVNQAVASVWYQEELKRQFPPDQRLRTRAPVPDMQDLADLLLLERAHPDLGRLGVFWHTQGSGKSYSMIFFAEKVRRTVPGNFTFVVMTDRDDLDGQIYRYFVGCGVADEKTTPRASNGEDLRRLLGEDHRYIFSLIHKFNQPVSMTEPYSRRDDIIIISDEAHRTQSGKLARNMRLALPNAAFIGFTGTPLFKQDELTRRIFGGYVSRYDFRRAEEDHATVRLVYENRGEKLGIARLDLNDRIAKKIEEAELDPDQVALLERLLGKDYEVITADDRLDKIADDFVEHCAQRWQSGKSMMVCIDKLTCARMYQRILPRWKDKIIAVQAVAKARAQELVATQDERRKEIAQKQWDFARGQAAWMESTLIEIIISEGQNEVKEFAKWDFDIRPHRALMKNGFTESNGQCLQVDNAFKDPKHPFRVAIVCAMWLTGFDVECLSTLYIDKPMRAHNLMQAIARANRVYGDKDCGVIVDYNGVMKSLREALALYALGDDGAADKDEIVIPIEERVKALVQGLNEAEQHLGNLGFDVGSLQGATGFDRIQALRDAVEAVYTSDETKRRFEIMAREVFSRFKSLITEPAVYAFAERHDNIEAIYKKLEEKRDNADVTDLLKQLHKIVNEAILAQGVGVDHAEGLTVDLSRINFEKLRDEFEKRVTRKHAALADIRQVVEQRLAAMLAQNPKRMDYYAKYQQIVAAYNREKDRATVEYTFAQLMDLALSMDAEQRRCVAEGLSEDELALFDLIQQDKISKADRERVKQSSRQLLAALRIILASMQQWTAKEQTQAEVQTLILDQLYRTLPIPPLTPADADAAAARIYDYVWQRSETGWALATASAAG